MSPHSSTTLPLSEAINHFDLESAKAAIIEYLGQQRWFAVPDAGFELQFTDVGSVRRDNLTIIFTTVQVTSGGENIAFNLWFSLRQPEDAADSGVEYHTIATINVEGEARLLLDALADVPAALMIWDLLREHAEITTAKGRLQFTRLDETFHLPTEARPAGAEQTNSSLIGGNDFLKLIRRGQEGPSVELEMASGLQEAGFAHAPKLRGSIKYEIEEQPSAAVGLLYEYLHNGTDGWSLALTSLRDLYARTELEDAPVAYATAQTIREQGGSFVHEAARIGEVTAALHTTLSREDLPVSLRPQAISAADLRAWAHQMNQDLAGLLHLHHPLLAPLQGKAPLLQSRISAIERLVNPGVATRIHGDYHLGQVLRTDAGWYVLDLDGEPLRTTAERRRRWSPLRDVAGMLRSLDYAAAVALMERISPDDANWQQSLQVGLAWSAVNRKAFWQAYWQGIEPSRLFADLEIAEILRTAFEIQKAIYEIQYELQHRPNWVHIPISFLTGVA